ncbi:hypothetical protein Ddye_029160 [Dipteronia dyeriana]|uniref:Reverse transcriptase domain-containing protein n=1 Tax=Dipteronia dyeriana TaxID=168575 RepID=A0AAD9WLJ4_9ROSI|nr:hypothetical protein Ddye_029160 [Dipteronia dyeriana]
MRRGVLNDGQGLEVVNETLITFIPKVKKADKITNYRPISLCNVLYKIVAKTLANRFRGVLGDVISETQSAFIPGRLISDNAIVGFGCIHALRCRKKWKVGAMAIKLDMLKAYDRVEWDFLAAMLGKLGFSDSWIDRIMRCITSVSFSFLINDDNMMFSKVTTRDCKAIRRVLDIYACASGQSVNFHKSAMYVSKKVSHDMTLSLAKILGVRLVPCHDRYLGLPSFTGKNRRELYNSIKDRVWERVKGWQSKLFSVGG